MAIFIDNASEVICIAESKEPCRRGADLGNLVVIPNGSVLIEGERIEWVGPSSELPSLLLHTNIINAEGKTVLPGLIDSHTHLIFAGARADEFEQRLAGASYQEIAARGGGILATVRDVRKASKEELKMLARGRLRRMLRLGVTTVEIKSGYGLTTADEIKCLEAIAELNAEETQELVPTFLGAHTLPPEFADDRDGYLRLLTDEMLPEIARRRLAEFCDVFCDEGAFSLAESERVLSRAQDLGLPLKLHADELSSLGGAELAARLGAASADHLLRISDDGLDALADSDTVATLLPGTAFFLGLDYAPARRLIERGAIVALASDCNPGTCPTDNLPLIGALACAGMKMRPAEVLTALTLNAACALGRSNRLGSIEPGKQADLVICDVPSHRHLFYQFGINHVSCVIKAGQVAWKSDAGASAG